MTGPTSGPVPDVVVDDERTLAGAVHFRQSADARSYLDALFKAGGSVDRLWLDFDLAHGDTTEDLAQWLAERGAQGQVGRVFIHSRNAVGAQTLFRMLGSYGPSRRVPERDGTPSQRRQVQRRTKRR